VRCLVVLQDEGWAVLCSLTNKTHKLNQEITGTQVCITLLPAYTSFLYSTSTIHTDSILILTLRNVHKTTPLIPKHTRQPTELCTLPLFPAGLPSTICNCTTMLTFRKSIHFQLAAVSPKGISRGKGKTRAKMPTSVINGRLSFNRDCIKGYISEHIRGLIRIYNVCGVHDEKVWDHFYGIIFLDPVTTRDIAQFQLMWPHCRSRNLPFREWWAAFCFYMGQMFHRTREEMNSWRWDNTRASRDQVDCSNPQTTTTGKVILTGERFSWSYSDDLRAKIEPPSCRQYESGDFLAITPLNWDEIINENDENDNWADPGALSGGTSHPGDGNGSDESEGEEDTQGGEKGTGKGKGTQDGNGEGKATDDWKGKGKGKGKANSKGRDIVK